MNRKLIISVALVVLSSSIALAADPVPADQSAVFDEGRFDWSGLYAGGVTGWSHASSNTDIPVYSSNFDIGMSGIAAGGYAGINWQNSDIVFGIEGDWLWAHLEGDELSGNGTERYFLEENWRASIRARLGKAVDDTLYYVTGGIAWVNLDQLYSFVLATPTSETLHGWTVGAGLEKALGSNWSVKLEYLYADFGSQTFQCSACGPSSNDYMTHSVQAGIAYRF